MYLDEPVSENALHLPHEIFLYLCVVAVGVLSSYAGITSVIVRSIIPCCVSMGPGKWTLYSSEEMDRIASEVAEESSRRSAQLEGCPPPCRMSLIHVDVGGNQKEQKEREDQDSSRST